MGPNGQLGVEHDLGHGGVIAALTCHRDKDRKNRFACGWVAAWVSGMLAGADHLLDRFGHRQFVDIDTTGPITTWLSIAPVIWMGVCGRAFACRGLNSGKVREFVDVFWAMCDHARAPAGLLVD